MLVIYNLNKLRKDTAYTKSKFISKIEFKPRALAFVLYFIIKKKRSDFKIPYFADGILGCFYLFKFCFPNSFLINTDQLTILIIVLNACNLKYILL